MHLLTVHSVEIPNAFLVDTRHFGQFLLRVDWCCVLDEHFSGAIRFPLASLSQHTSVKATVTPTTRQTRTPFFCQISLERVAVCIWRFPFEVCATALMLLGWARSRPSTVFLFSFICEDH